MEKHDSIKEAAQKFGLAPSALRWYESEGLLDPVPKSESGHRMYGPKEYRRINFIVPLRNAGVPVEEIRRYVELFHEGEQTIPVRKQILIDRLTLLKEEAGKLNDVIRQLETMIDHYEDTLMKRELDSRRNDPHYG